MEVLAYERTVCLDAVHNRTTSLDEIWIPTEKLIANLHPYQHQQFYVFESEEPRYDCKIGPDGKLLPTTDIRKIRVPSALVKRLVAILDLQKQMQKLKPQAIKEFEEHVLHFKS